jgi:hypothetical protein
MAEMLLEHEAPAIPSANTYQARSAQSAQAEAIAQRLALFRETLAVIDATPDHRAEAGLGALPDNAVALSYADREAVTL